MNLFLFISLCACYVAGACMMALWLNRLWSSRRTLKAVPTVLCFAFWPITIFLVLLCLAFNLDRRFT